MKLRNYLLGSMAAASLGILGSAPAHANNIVATIVGAYDYSAYDTPELDFTNSSGGALVNAQMVLTGYQGLNNHVTQTVDLSGYGFANGSTTAVVWGYIPGADGSTSPGNLTAYDYDDEWGNTPPGYTNPGCTVTTGLCSLVGNFKVVFTATISGGPNNGKAVFASFSPTTNYTGGFVGWLGLDPTGLSETAYDNHSGTFSGTMAVIRLGVPGVPEPATWGLMIAGMGLAGASLRRRKAAIA